MTNPGFNQHDNDTNVDYRGGIVLPSAGGTRVAGGNTGAAGADGLNVPSKPVAQGVQGANTQASRRWTDTFWDNHRTSASGRFPNGRPWTGERELSANPDLKQEGGFVTTDLQQGEYVADDAGNVDRAATFRSVWHAPFIPLAKYFVFDYKRKRISFGYQRMLMEEQVAHDKYYEAAAKLGAGLNIAVEYGQMPKFQITADLGSPLSYIRNIRIAQAAMAGDPWILGFIDEPNAELAKLLGYNERSGMRMMSFTPEPKAVVTPEQVLATPNADLMAMIEELRAQNATMQATINTLAAPKKSHKKKVTAQPAQKASSDTPAAA